jgi:short subunit dehydrogenase-like uncharacterized protein
MTAGRAAPTIAIYGATGHSGRQVARELAGSETPIVLVGRNRDRLAALAADLGGDVAVHAAPLDDPPALRRALTDCAAVISCAGPFARYGEPIVAAAIDAGVHYLDISGEQSYIRHIFSEYGARAEHAGVALIPAVGIDSVPADMLATLAAEGLGSLRQITVVIDVRGGRTNTGSLLTLLDAAHRREGLRFANGAFGPAPRQLRGGSWRLTDGESVGLMRFAGAEVVLLPRHLDTAGVEVFFAAGSALPGWVPGQVGVAAMRAAEGLARSALYPRLRPLIARLPAPKQDITRIAVEVEVESTAGQRRRAVLTAPGAYRLTALAAARATVTAATPGFDRCGPLTPAEAFVPIDFLDSLGPSGVTYRVGNTSPVGRPGGTSLTART